MTWPLGLDVTERPLADQWTLMSHPPRMRRGVSLLQVQPQPAAGANFTRKVDNAWWERIVSLYFTLACSAAAGVRSVSVNLLDADGNIFNATLAILAASPGETWAVSADLAGTPGPQAATSLVAQGTVTSPAAGATVATITLPAGEWAANWNVSLSGTVAAADANNFALTVPGLLNEVSDNPGAAGGPWGQNPATFEVPAGGSVLKIKVIGAGTAGAVYDGALSVVAAGTLTTYPQLPDIVLRSGWQAQIAVAGIQAGDQLSAINLMVERYPSNYADGTMISNAEDAAAYELG